jgi:hypothetical protein
MKEENHLLKHFRDKNTERENTRTSQFDRLKSSGALKIRILRVCCDTINLTPVTLMFRQNAREPLENNWIESLELVIYSMTLLK